MLSCFNPKHLAVAGSLLASVTFAASASSAATPAPANGSDSGAAPSSPALSAGDMTVVRVLPASPIADPYSKLNWLIIQVDFQGKIAGRVSVINDVSVTLSVAWEKLGASPPVELMLTSTARFVGVLPNKPASVLFFIPPETLARSSKGVAFDSSRLPDFYTVQFKINDNPVPMSANNYSSIKMSSLEVAKSFASMATSSGLKGLMFTEASVPTYIRDPAMSRLSSNYFPTFVSEGADAGH
ncbi:MAG TPA: hypothetical protein VHC95_06580 [Opitutales bacterium]|nr:hypothetical protein [Opitutales bacterium]